VLKQELVIVNKLGLHARAAAKFVSTASRFQSALKVSRGSQTVNGKSIMGVMMLAAAQHSSITLELDGPDESTALAALSELVARRFDEVE